MARFERGKLPTIRELQAIEDRTKGSLQNLVSEVPGSPAPPGALQFVVPARVIEVIVLSDWYNCGAATGNQIFEQVDGQGNKSYFIDTTTTYILDDPLGKIDYLLASVDDQTTGELYIPSGYVATVWQPVDTIDGHWRPLVAGNLCGSSEEGSSEEGSSEEGSSEEGSACPFPVTGNAAEFPGFSPNVVQALGHDANGCWMWLNTEKCP
jgi:hypothetical protein